MTTISTAPSLQSNDHRDPALHALIRESLAHPAVKHPFLTRFAACDFPNMVSVLRRYALDYSGYSAWFPRYLTTVISRLSQADHRDKLEHNLEEEQGHLGADDCQALLAQGINPATVAGVPHPVLFRRFCNALGIPREELGSPSPAATRWRTRFLSYLQNATAAEAVGALGLGTEHIVRPVYEQLLKGIMSMGTLRRDEFVFFELHCLVDDQHQLDLLEIARDLAAAPGGLAGLRRGMQMALALRCEFWDHLYNEIVNDELANYA
ncbi:MAG: pyrroloquinoline quinone (PQQ) biosynthesis protein C [Planctomycetota bacterium]|jgi:pyrroloquinoline quinone (PQQ) biosynthesis protein C